MLNGLPFESHAELNRFFLFMNVFFVLSVII